MLFNIDDTNNSAIIKAILNNPVFTVGILDEKGQYIHVNEKWCDLFGYSAEESEAFTTVMLTHSEFKKESQKMMQSLSKKEIDSFRSEKKLIKKDGSTFWGEVSTSLIQLNDNHFYILELIADISDKYQFEILINRTQQKFEELFEEVPIGIIKATIEGKIIDINPAAARMFGYNDPEDVLKTVKNMARDTYVDPGRHYEILKMIKNARHWWRTSSL